MPPAINQFRKFQAGIEATHGTAVAAKRQFIGDWSFDEEREFYRSEYPHGFNTRVGGVGTEIQTGTGLSVQTELTFEELLLPLLTGIRGGVTPSNDDDAETWTFEPGLTSDPLIDSATVELTESDGTVNHLAREAAYCMTESIGIEWSINQIARLSYDMFGRRSLSEAPTAALTPFSNREIAVSQFLSLYMDDSWANLGNTQLQGVVRSATLNIDTPLTAGFTLDGQGNNDMVKHLWGSGFRAGLSLTLEVNAAAAGILADWRANEMAFVRLAQRGSLIQDDPDVFKEIRFDAAMRFLGNPPGYSSDEGNRLVQIEMENVFDRTSVETFAFTLTNREPQFHPDT